MLSDRIGVMRAGRLEQIGTARELYERPASVFVARFLGESNLLGGQVTRLEGDAGGARGPGWPAPIAGRGGAGAPRRGEGDGADPPRAGAAGAEASDAVDARVEEVVYLGDLVALRLLAPGRRRTSGAGVRPRGVPRARRVKAGFGREDVRILPD